MGCGTTRGNGFSSGASGASSGFCCSPESCSFDGLSGSGKGGGVSSGIGGKGVTGDSEFARCREMHPSCHSLAPGGHRHAAGGGAAFGQFATLS